MPSGIWVLGFVSLLMDISSEMIHSLLPLFMVTTLDRTEPAGGDGRPFVATRDEQPRFRWVA